MQGEKSKNALVLFYCRTVVYCALRNSKRMKISYDWRGMPVEFKIQNTENSEDGTRLTMMYDGSGRCISKTRARKAAGGDWETELVTHYTGIGTEVRENPANKEIRVVVNMPNGLGRYGVEDAEKMPWSTDPLNFEWYLKNHLGSTMLVYGTQGTTDMNKADVGEAKAKYYYRSFGERIVGMESSDKVTEHFTGSAAETKVVVNMPNGLGRYGIEDSAELNSGASKTFEWFLMNHLESTMLVYGTQSSTDPKKADVGVARISTGYEAGLFGAEGRGMSNYFWSQKMVL